MAGVKSTALMFGENTKKWLSLFSMLTLSNLGIAGISAELSWPYFASLVIAASHLYWQVKTVDIHNKENCLKKFVANKWFGAIIFAGVVASRLIQ